ncbi:MAG: FprA family A-type flavoprotein, partial [Bacteroidetes bacterium]|nr:FprA family A-type flavoprotein [Bacteroidota bacterium]
SPTLNRNILPTVAAWLTYLNGLSPKNRKAIAFGSYGWGDQSIPKITEYLKTSGFDIIGTYKVKFIPDEEDLENIRTDLRTKV